MEHQIIYAKNGQKLNKNTFTWTGHVFSGWNSKVDGNGTRYKDEAVIYNFDKE
jgi:hypothetical protein